MVEPESPGDPSLRLAHAAVNPRRQYTWVISAFAFLAAVYNLKSDYDFFLVVDVKDDVVAPAFRSEDEGDFVEQQWPRAA